MDKPLDELYLEWLYDKVAAVEFTNPSKTYWSLLRQLYISEFVWFIPNDDNRLEDGRDLRREFVQELGIDHPDEGWMTLGCSMLEMLLALSGRLVFEAEGDTSIGDWFWHLLDNLKIGNLNDRYFSEEHEAYVQNALDAVIWRTYDTDGRGGLFPLRDPEYDQRELEVWYQLSCYLLEGHGVR